MSASHDNQNGYRVPFYRYEYFYYIMFLHKSKDGILLVRIAGKIPFLFLNRYRIIFDGLQQVYHKTIYVKRAVI